MNVQFREATKFDIPAILDLLEDDHLGRAREGAPMDVYVQAFKDMHHRDGNAIIVGEIDGMVVATYQLTVIPGLSLRAARRAQLESVRVSADLRGSGIGTMMLDDAESRARNAGCTLLQLTMNGSRTDAGRFYERLGFTPSHIGFKRDLS